jgi:hypothetical protein
MLIQEVLILMIILRSLVLIDLSVYIGGGVEGFLGLNYLFV